MKLLRPVKLALPPKSHCGITLRGVNGNRLMIDVGNNEIHQKSNYNVNNIDSRLIATQFSGMMTSSSIFKEFRRLKKKNDGKMYQNKIATIEQNMHLSNSIVKLRQSLSNFKTKRNSTEKIQKLGAKRASKEGSDDKIRKLRKDKSSSSHIINNAIDKTGQSSSKNSRSNYQNLKASKLPVAELLSSPKILSTSSTHVDEHNYNGYRNHLVRLGLRPEIMQSESRITRNKSTKKIASATIVSHFVLIASVQYLFGMKKKLLENLIGREIR
uniref:Uncharacterized protein n=1 Tax=Onchocerca volvulus TaxID=6282 RepID=A0A8R1U0U2_ONCVO